MSAEPRVTFVGPVPPISGGIAQHSARVVEALEACGAPTTVLSWSAQYPKVLFKGSGRDPASMPYAGARFMLRWWDPVSWWRAGRIAHSGDLLVMPWVTPVLALPQRVIDASARVPLSLFVHNALPHERMFADARLARWVMRRAAHIVVHSEPLANVVHDLAPRVPISVVPHPPNIEVTPTPLPPRPPLRLLCLGFVRPYKGFDLAVDAVRRLRGRGVDAQLTIAGEVWDDKEGWRARVADPDLAGSVELVDRYVSDDEVAALLAAHHIVVAPYRSATQSGIVPLAFAAGRPVVATAVGGLPECVADGETGRLVAPEDVTPLADAIADVADDLDAYAKRASGVHTSWNDVACALLTPVSSPPA